MWWYPTFLCQRGLHGHILHHLPLFLFVVYNYVVISYFYRYVWWGWWSSCTWCPRFRLNTPESVEQDSCLSSINMYCMIATWCNTSSYLCPCHVCIWYYDIYVLYFQYFHCMILIYLGSCLLVIYLLLYVCLCDILIWPLKRALCRNMFGPLSVSYVLIYFWYIVDFLFFL